MRDTYGGTLRPPGLARGVRCRALHRLGSWEAREFGASWLLVIRITQLLFIRHVFVIRKKTMEAGLGRRAAAAPVAGTGACGGARPRALGLKRLARRRSSRTKEIGASARSAESRPHTPAPDPRHHTITQTCRLIAELATLVTAVVAPTKYMYTVYIIRINAPHWSVRSTGTVLVPVRVLLRVSAAQ